MPSRTYIISNPSSQKIHFDPTITDFQLYQLAAECNEMFLRFTRELGLFKGRQAKDVCELILVSGGFYYHLNQAFYNVFGYSLPAGFIGVRRVLGDKPHGAITYDNLEAIPKNNLTIIGDTIATGATLIDSIRYYLRKKSNVKKIIIFTIAGALPGARRLAEIEKEIKRKYGTELYAFFSDGIFGLSENQTDMHYFHPARSRARDRVASLKDRGAATSSGVHSDSILAPESAKAAEKNLGRFLGKRLCVIWDWGQRNKDPIGHLHEVIKVCGKLGKAGKGIIKKAKAKLKERERDL